MSFSRIAASHLTPLLARILLCAVFVPIGWKNIMGSTTFTGESVVVVERMTGRSGTPNPDAGDAATPGEATAERSPPGPSTDSRTRWRSRACPLRSSRPGRPRRRTGRWRPCRRSPELIRPRARHHGRFALTSWPVVPPWALRPGASSTSPVLSRGQGRHRHRPRGPSACRSTRGSSTPAASRQRSVVAATTRKTISAGTSDADARARRPTSRATRPSEWPTTGPPHAVGHEWEISRKSRGFRTSASASSRTGGFARLVVSMNTAEPDNATEPEAADRPQGRLATPMSWSVSVMLHLGVLVIASLVTWSIVSTPEDRPIVVLSTPTPDRTSRRSRTSAPTRRSPPRRRLTSRRRANRAGRRPRSLLVSAET